MTAKASQIGALAKALAHGERPTNSIRHAPDLNLVGRVRAETVMILIPKTELGVGSLDLHPHDKVRN